MRRPKAEGKEFNRDVEHSQSDVTVLITYEVVPWNDELGDEAIFHESITNSQSKIPAVEVDTTNGLVRTTVGTCLGDNHMR